jgi:hypothetical protein
VQKWVAQMTWFDLVKISVIDEVLQHLESTKNSYFRDLKINYQPAMYGMNKQRDTFYVNTKSDLHDLAGYFYESDDFDIIHLQGPYPSEGDGNPTFPDMHEVITNKPYDHDRFIMYISHILHWFIVRKK